MHQALLALCICAAEPDIVIDDFQNHGVAAAVSESRGIIAAAGSQGEPLILALSMDTYESRLRVSLLVIDARQGETRQYWYPEREAANGANYCVMLSSRNRLYVMFGDVFLEFDTGKRAWTYSEDAGHGTAMSLLEGPGGTVYAATYPSCMLLAFDPGEQSLNVLGQLDPAEKYPMTLAADGHGWVYAGIGTARANLVAFDTNTRECRHLLEENARQTGTGHVRRGEDGQVYGRAPGTGWFQLENGKAVPVEVEPPDAEPQRSISWQRVFRTFPGGGVLHEFDLADRRFTVEDADGARQEQQFDYASAGALITSMAMGPSGHVYGSVCHPFRLFRCDGDTGELTNLGGLDEVGGGNFCALTTHGTTVYGAEYAGGRLYAYDTAKPWHDSGDASANPREAAQFKEALCRPRSAITLKGGRCIVYAGFPGYGRVGGGLGVYDVQSGTATLIENADLLPGHSTITMRALSSGMLVCGTSIDAPGGGHPTAEAGAVYVYDLEARRVLRTLVPVPDARAVSCLETGPDGLIYGITDNAVLFVLDPRAEEVRHTSAAGAYGNPLRPDQSLLPGPGGRVLVLLNECLLEVNPRTFAPRKLAGLPEHATAGTAFSGERLYYAAGGIVWSCRIDF